MKDKLFSEFPPITTAEWEAVINKDLKGADYEKSLVWKTLEGINVRPYYRAEHIENNELLKTFPAQFPYIRGNNKTRNDWKIRQDIQGENLEEANHKALDALMKGADSIGFVFKDDFSISQSDFSKLLKDIVLTAVEINFVALHGSHAVLPLLENEVKTQEINPKDIYGSITFDPIGNMSLKGAFNKAEEFVFDTVKEIVSYGKEKFPNLRVLAVNGQHFNNCGASAVQELAFSLAIGSEYLSKLTDRKLAVDDITPRMKFSFGVGANYFMEIAKIRAARLLWAKLVEAYNPKSKTSCQMYIHSTTSEWNMTAYDPYVNTLRTTTEAMSAAIGGADSLLINPFDKPYKNSDEFSERIARNQQIILKEESYLDRVVDPSAGSYYIENLTSAIANEAWKLFLTVQDKGGYLVAFKEGFIQKEVEETANKRNQNIAQRREILLGTNQYPNNNELIKSNIDLTVLNKTIKTVEKDQYGKPLKPFRGAMAFEELRLKTENHAFRPKVMMFPYGNLAMRKARSMFSCNFFACAGFETLDNNGFATIEDGIKAVMETKPSIVVICSSDDEYATIVPEIFGKLKNNTIIVVAGAPACAEELKAKGITNFISVKSNVLQELKNYQKLLGI